MTSILRHGLSAGLIDSIRCRESPECAGDILKNKLTQIEHSENRRKDGEVYNGHRPRHTDPFNADVTDVSARKQGRAAWLDDSQMRAGKKGSTGCEGLPQPPEVGNSVTCTSRLIQNV